MLNGIIIILLPFVKKFMCTIGQIKDAKILTFTHTKIFKVLKNYYKIIEVSLTRPFDAIPT